MNQSKKKCDEKWKQTVSRRVAVELKNGLKNCLLRRKKQNISAPIISLAIFSLNRHLFPLFPPSFLDLIKNIGHKNTSKSAKTTPYFTEIYVCQMILLFGKVYIQRQNIINSSTLQENFLMTRKASSVTVVYIFL